jgi:membrane-associated protein
MSFIMTLFDFVIHLDAHLRLLATDYGTWAYVLLFLLIFCETGLVVTPFLPGDSVLFMLGTLAAGGFFGLVPSLSVLMVAAVVGNVVNYQIGRFLGPRAFSREKARFFKKENLDKAQAFYDRWGGVAIVLGRFMPIIRTFVPFAAGIGKMRYGKFLFYNVVGSVAWVALFIMCGYFFGNIPFVQKNLTPIIYGIVFVSLVPAFVGLIKSRSVSGAGKGRPH